MSDRAANSGTRWIALAVIAVACALLGFAGIRNAVAAHLAGSADQTKWIRAAELEPTDAELWYQLGRYRQLDFENENLPLAISYYQRAAALNPASATYWMDLASAYETNGNVTQAEQSFQFALQDHP